MTSVLRFLMLLAVCLSVTAGHAAQGFLSDDSTDRLSTVPHDPAMQKAVIDAGLNLVIVQHDGWEETLPSFARLKIYELTGREKIHGQDPSYTILSMIYTPDRWFTARILPVEHPDLLTALGLDGKWVSPRQVVESPKLQALIADLQAKSKTLEEMMTLRKRLNAAEQVERLGRSDRTMTAFENDGVTPEQITSLLDDKAKMKLERARLAELTKTVKGEQPFRDAAERLLTRAQLLPKLPEQFLILPDTEAAEDRWIRPVNFSGTGSSHLASTAHELELALDRAFVQGDLAGLSSATASFLEAAKASRYYPTEKFRKAQNLYVGLNPWMVAAAFYLLGACIAGIFMFFGNPWLRITAFVVMLGGFLFHTLAVILRGYLTGHIPVSNMFESITFCSWAMMLIATVWEAINRKGLVSLGAMIVGFLLLMGAGQMPLHQTRIHALRAVLNSYWLNIHVTMMLVSYATFGIAAFFSAMYLIRSVAENEAKKVLARAGGGGAGFLSVAGILWLFFPSAPADTWPAILKAGAFAVGLVGVLASVFLAFSMGASAIGGRRLGEQLITLEQTEEFAYRLVQLGWPILTFGITLGAVWADTAWGRYWGWDPKETWAFITWVTYTVYLHTRMVMGWRGRGSALACLAGFGMVMITWWGVSYLPWFSGGLHTYASPTG